MKKSHNHNFKDITGQVFNRLTVIKFDGVRKKRTYWICKCECGVVKSIQRGHLISGVVKSCGCFQHDSLFKDLTGKIFTWLTVIKLDRIKNRRAIWLCRCECGINKNVKSSDLINQKVRSCGCLRRILQTEKHKTHGMINTRIYGIWAGMKNRCTNPNNQAYKDYGGRGIKLCDEWLTFEGFYKDNGESYEEHVKEFGEDNTTADRYPDVNGNYERGNFRWATIKEQSRRKRTSVQSDNYTEHIYWKQILTAGLHTAINPNSKRSFITKYLSCSLEKFHKYFESNFLPGMTWENNGRGKGKWQIDHIVGCNNFDLSKEEDRKACFNYLNLRPMWDVEHKKKSKKRIV